ncbi:arginyltransferase [Nitrosococcus wardiae]|uniref:Aspartate/glutamate leucyltransferase n=1 Tax=Nitrosococcus wardiae TaxID=1814290 RepID=A0A4P7BUI8_9GAMM|nr:arginyltransferase [Nitrosococcus wardiae]QBQ53608.1 arginyltransferase [Nitrosococcus wardiae]
MTSYLSLDFYLSSPHSCGYLPGQTATNLFVDPEVAMDIAHYSTLARLGFRRSGRLVYRPHCSHCSACLPVRIPVAQFQPNRSQQRAWKINQDLSAIYRPVEFRAEHFDLFYRYLKVRHVKGGMDNSTPEDYLSFIASDWDETSLIEFRDAKDQLLAVAVIDALTDGISAVYSFFDPILKRRSLGVYIILWEINEAKELNLPYVYLGYWIKACQKMQYKSTFRPLEVYQDKKWSIFEET